MVEPQIPPNTGNIGRLAVGSDAVLHIIKPIGFDMSDRALKRAGLDYWDKLNYFLYDSLEEFWKAHPLGDRHFFFSTKSNAPYFENSYKIGDYLYFGREDAGLPESLIEHCAKNTYTIPISNIRSLNLATAVGIVLYEAYRQNYQKTSDE